MKFSKRLMACGLAVVMASTCSGASDVALAAKKPSLSQKKVTITAGKKKTIKVKNASKTVKWSSNKKKVVTVKGSGKKKATGTLKGVSKGTATVTAKVGSKKLTCKVTVKKASSSSMQNAATNIQSVDVDALDERCIVLTLKKAAPLNVSDLVIGVKAFKEGSYNYYPTIKTIASADQKTWRIYLNKYIGYSDWVKVTIGGKDSVEHQYKRDVVGLSKDVYLEKDKVVTLNIDGFDEHDEHYYSESHYFSNTVGTVTYAIASGKLPDGLTLNTKRGIIKGIPTTAGEYQVTLKATDELGRSATATINYKVYDEKTIMVSNETASVRLNDYVDAVTKDPKYVASTDVYEYVEIKPLGGSGKYKFALQNTDGSAVRLSTNSNNADGTLNQRAAATTNLLIPYSISEGTHTYTITVEDAQDANRKQTLTVTVNATRYYNISGTAKDTFGTELTGNKLYFYPVGSTSEYAFEDKVVFGAKEEGGSVIDTADTVAYTSKVGTNTDSNAQTGDKKGTYAAELAPGEYIVKIQSDADDIRYEMNEHIVVTPADEMRSVVAPIRFYSVSAVAKYKNGSLIRGEKVYFETKEEQYEKREYEYSQEAMDMKFSVKTGSDGTFIASLPANNYVAYILDEDGYRRYFSLDVTVTNADIVLNDFNSCIERYTVAGAVSDAAGVLKKQELRIYDANGDYRTTTTDEEGNFQIGLPGGATYVLKAQIDGVWHKLGTVSVSTQDLLGQKFTYAISQEFLNAPEIQLGQSTPYSVAEGAVSAKFVSKGGNHTFTAAVSNNQERDKMSLYVFDKDGKLVTSQDKISDDKTVKCSASLSDGTYYIMLIPENERTKRNPETGEEKTYDAVEVSGQYMLTVN